MNRALALRGHVVTCVEDPFVVPTASALVDIIQGVVVVRGGVIETVGEWAHVRGELDDDCVVVDYGDNVIVPGFIDAHVHYVQTQIMGSYGQHLLEWLNDYTFPAEERFRSFEYAKNVASFFLDDLVRNGTTSALVFCAVYSASVDALFEEALARNMRIIAGKVLMDRNAPDALLDSVASGYEESQQLINRWHERGRLLYAVTPRFAPTCSDDQLTMAGELHATYPTTLVHTHISETLAEIAWVKELFPQRTNYLDVYDHANLLGPRTVLAHGVHLSEPEIQRLHDTDTALAHCPTSNLFLGSGLFQMRSVKDNAASLKVGLGSDVGAGTSLSLLRTMGEAYKVAKLSSYPMNAAQLLYLATLGGARALASDECVGSLEVGKDADIVILDPRATPIQEFCNERATTTEEKLFLFGVLGDDRSVTATYVAGNLLYERRN